MKFKSIDLVERTHIGVANSQRWSLRDVNQGVESIVGTDEHGGGMLLTLKQHREHGGGTAGVFFVPAAAVKYAEVLEEEPKAKAEEAKAKVERPRVPPVPGVA